MRAFLVVTDDPLMGDLANLIERPKEPAVKDFRPIGAIEAFNESILIRLAGLDMAQFNAFFRAPIGKVAARSARAHYPVESPSAIRARLPVAVKFGPPVRPASWYRSR